MKNRKVLLSVVAVLALFSVTITGDSIYKEIEGIDTREIIFNSNEGVSIEYSIDYGFLGYGLVVTAPQSTFVGDVFIGTDGIGFYKDSWSDTIGEIANKNYVDWRANQTAISQIANSLNGVTTELQLEDYTLIIENGLIVEIK